MQAVTRRFWAFGRLAPTAAIAMVTLVAGWMTRRSHRTTLTAHTVVVRRRRRPATIPALEGVLDG